MTRGTTVLTDDRPTPEQKRDRAEGHLAETRRLHAAALAEERLIRRRLEEAQSLVAQRRDEIMAAEVNLDVAEAALREAQGQ
ncbi:hypothetical protein [Neoroseomonas oryzicola]|uniref:Uncharacterized protein n=1 Tax=Neoroseomonas oryzicola TaxID=535904 RepID=A0A9X9WIQ7_9PROT|nr:hypothetical protein [Neoroseomonas oryzicola]MBR0660217.1 hypothetical protein [Neoroseomonas oryzicola]NKE16708.1 hypothetical protein [Neoroseomonas oryzicola]